MSHLKLNKHPTLQFTDDIKIICKPLLLSDITYFAHVRIDQENNFTALGLNPEYVKMYFEKKYYNFDIHVGDLVTDGGYILWDLIEVDKESKALDDDYRNCGYGHTFTVMQKGKKHNDFYHFGAALGNSSINQFYMNHIDMLKKFINYFNDKINNHKELADAYDIKFKIDCEVSQFSIKELTHINPVEITNLLNSERLYLDRDHYLTKREWECLYWLSKGKTLEETALILSITNRTVKAHIQNIKDKFDCQNLFQLGIVFEKFKSLRNSCE